MGRPKAPEWTAEETAILTDVYPREGINGATEALPDRSWRAIFARASKLGLKSPVVASAPKGKLQGDQLERAIRMREEDGQSFANIGDHLGVSESAACNAVMIALCARKGFRPAERDANGRLLPEGVERLRYALRKGYRGVDIQLRLGLSASRIAEERRRYNRDLKARGKAPLPPAGGGDYYSGARISAADIRKVEQLLLQGLGAKKIAERLPVSNTTVGRVRNRLIKRLSLKGECLPGCDMQGRRVRQIESTRFIAPAQEAELRKLILQRMPVRRAARLAGIGACSAYRIRDELREQLARDGQALPTPKRAGRLTPRAREIRAAEGIPAAHIYRYRELLHTHDESEARRLLRAEIAESRRALTFEEQLARVAAGATLTERFTPARAEPDRTLGGIATAAL